ncbi:2-amino-4-hydroxy-6-hydroxymethyldihydropteridine diphosphokinase [Novosphingobium sp. 9]|uniref:2-amino-4-hydroxy-6- hydroxymethyldihydropteridine diphosphokinase n=1 Tax=Novosphingobium sp. 9 TaxID=2025349 RepID=UPI0021B50073|nr:2-amino-4-hydroxy-6-hydroxymethyldihydropteridine diphosphokinase [Novosphingobium sp. 9]
MHHYLIALGSNRRHPQYGLPRRVLTAALDALSTAGLRIEAASPLLESAPIGPSLRRYANGAAVVASDLEPEPLLDLLLEIEAQFGRKRRGQAWSSRVLDLDVVLWSGGAYAGDHLVIPHPLYRRRDFVLAPARRIAPHWRDPLSGLTPRHHHARLTKRRKLPR